MKMRDALRHLAALLAVVLPLNLLAPVAQVSAAAPPQLPGPARQEIVERRSEYAKHFRETDGKVTMEVYAAPVHQRDERGHWQAMDRSIKASQRAAFGWSHASARFRADFAQTSGDRVARMEAGEHWVEWSLEGLAQVPGQAKGGDVTYPQVLPGVDLRYKPTVNGVKEELVVSDDGTPHTYQIRLRSDLNVEPYLGGLRLTDAAGATVMTMPTPFVVDGAGETSVASLFHLGGDLYELRINENWFRHPHRVFPMIIDPTLELQPSGAAGMDTSITSAAPTLNYGGDTILRVGRNGTHQSRALLKFAVADLPAGAEVSSAQLSLYRTAGVGNTGLRGFELHALTTEWLETEATWQNAKGFKTWTTAGGDFDAAVIDGTKQIDTTTATTGNGWVTWNVTSQVSALARGGANLGFILQHTQSDTNRSEIHFTGSDSADSIHAPKLVITYTEDRTPPTVSITSTGPVTGNQVALQAQATDLGAGIDRVEFLVDGGVVGTAVTTDASGLYTVTVDSTRYTNGDHLVDVRAYDRAGNVGTEGNSVLLGSLAGATPGGDARLDGEAASLLVSAVPVTAGTPVVSGTKAVSDYSAARVRDSNNSTSWRSPGQSTSSGIESILLNLSSTRSVSEVLVTPARASDKLMARVELLDANGNPVNTGSSAWVSLTDGTDQQRAISLPFVSTSTAKVRVSFTNLRYDALTGLHHAEVAEIRVRYSYWETDHYDIYLWDGVSAGTSYGCTVSQTTTGNCSQTFDKGVSSAWANQRWVGSESCSTCGARSEQFIGPTVNIGTYSYQGNYTWRWTGTISWTTADPHTRTTIGSRRTVNTTTCPGVCENYSNYWWSSYVLFADSGQFSPDNGQMYWSNWPSDRRTFFGGWYTPGVATSFSVNESYYQYSYSSKTITFDVDRKTFQADSSLYTSDVSFTPEAPAYTESTAPTNAIDGNAGTFWLGTPAGGTGQRSDTAWIELPFATATTVNAVYIDPLAAGMSATVVVSLAGAEVSRTVVGDLRKGLITFPAVTADRIRVEFSSLLGGGPAYYAGLREVKPQHIAAGQNGTLISPAVTLGGASHLTLEAEDAQPAGTAIAYQFIFDQSVAVSATPGTPVAVPAGAASVAVHATLTGDGTKSPLLYNWSLTAPGSGRLLAFQNGPLSVVQEPAVLTFTSPLPQTTVSGSVNVQVTTSSAQVAQVKFYVDGVLSNTDTAAPWAWTWNTAAVPSGPHMLWAEAYNASGQKIGGGVSSAIVPSGSPLALTAVAAVGGTQLSWTAPVAGASYKIYRSTDNFVANSALVTTMTGTTFTDTGLVTGTRYYYRVTAVSGGAEGRPSLTASAVFGQPEAGGDRLGLERYYPYLTTPIAGHRAYVNLTNGNLVTQAEDLVLASPGLMAVVRRTMNTRPQPGSAAADWRWNHQISLTYDSAAQTAVLTNSDGAVYRFPEVNGQFQRPAGVYIWLARSGTGYTATHKNGVTWTFDSAGTLVSAKDRNGNTMQYRYDAAGQISQIVDTAGRPIDFGVTPSGQIGTVTYGPAADRRSVTYGYDALGRVSSVTDLAGQTWQYAYDLQDRLVAVTSPQGNIWSMVYDSAGRLSALADPLTNLISLSYGNLSTVVTDGRGNTTTFAYNTTGQLVRRTQVAGTQTITEQMAYDPEYNVTSLTNPLNKVTTATYDARGNLLTLVSPAPDAQASPVTVEYRYADPANPDQPTEVRHPLGIVELMAYDAYGNLTYRAQTRSGEAPTAYQRYAYNAYGLRVSERSLQGGITHYEYDARGNLIKTTDPLGNPTLYHYDWFGMVHSETSVAGDTTAFVYDRLGRIQHETFADNTTRRYFYSADGQLVRAVDNNGTAFDYQYDLAGRLAMEKGPTGQISYRYDNAGNISQIISPNGWITTNTYDAANRLSSVQVGSSVTAYTYNAAGQVVEAKNPNNNTVQFTYDDLGRQTKTVIAPGTLGSTWRTEYDARGRRTAQIDPLWHRISYVYDHLDRLTETRENLLSGVQHAVETTDASLLSQNFTAVGSAQIASDAASPYNGSYRLKVTASAAGAGVKAKVPVLLKKGQTITASVAASGSGSVTVDLYDEKNQSGSTPVTLTLGSAWTVSTPVSLTVGGSSGSDSDQVYLRVLSTVSGAATVYLDGLEVNQSTRTEYDPFPTGTAVLPASYEQRSVDVLGRTSRITFDLLGRTLSSTDALGNTFAMAYLDTLKRTVRTDALGRQTITQMDSRSRPSFVQYPDGSKVSVTYDGNGNMLTMADSLGLTVYQYDSANRLKRSVDPFGRVMSYEYEGAALKRVTSPVGTVTYNYDPNSGFVTSMVTKNALNQEETTSFQYDPAGNLKQKTTGSQTTTWTYDSGERLTGIEAKYGSSRRYQGTYAYDQAWNRNRYTLYNSYENTTTTFNYTFDPLYRLIKTTESNGNNRTYQYDGAGNRLARTDVKGGVTTQETYSYDAANRLLSMITTKNATSETTSYEYDANGNQTRIISPKGVGTLSYDFENRLVEFIDPVQGRVVNRYNGMGQKLYTMDGTDETYFLLDRGQVMADLDGAGATIAAYFRAPGGQLISTHQRTGTYYYHIDGLGSVVGLTKPDGTWDSLYQYDEFGVVQANKGQAWNNFQYTGATYSPTSGLYHLGARHYNPAIGRFITQDTYAGNPWQPWTKNLYVYVGNNPVNYIDPTGHFLVMITVNTFIPDARFWESAWLGEGDGRDLWESGSSRTTHTVYVDTETGAWFDEKSMHPSETLFWDFPAPSGDSMMATVWQDSDGNTMVAFVANEASEALAWSGATISYAFVITIDKNGDLSLVGVHDGFPAYEIYAYSDDQFAGYGYNPRDHWETLGSLFDWAGGPEKVTTGFNYFPYDESEDCTSEGFCSK